ncbi:MAG: phosphoenolpyruvate carboxykinase (ATP) [Gemmatimonadota bacterium]|nr:phosphoenolpyruvate carboxykinase (ATP) [Gemmatimonadota bacterium]MDH5757981.1 phosphoenolpyruvate carboxykinase (ATP) [Gemmatimonadota bacterium]
MTTQTTEQPMAASGEGSYGLENHGLDPRKNVYWNLSPARLYEESLARGDGRLVHMGAIAANTAPHTGRSPNDRYVVRDGVSDGSVNWGKVNVPISTEHFEKLRADVVEYLNEQDLFVRDARAGADDEYGINVRVVSERPWYSLFAYNMFLRPSAEESRDMVPDFTVIHAPHFKADPAVHGTRTDTAIVVSFATREVVVAGTRYAGEIKKSIFSVLNHRLPDQAVFPMHCSANIGEAGDVALFFGLSGTGKTTLSADAERGLIGDDEHGWSDRGVFNFEGGCYAKTIRLSPEGEPEIYRATQMFGTILENVVLDEDTREIDFDDGSVTENTRASYPIHYIPNAVLPSRGGHPKNVVFLTADAFGVLPPISRLTPEQAMYHFLSGYTAKVAGTERGVTEPKATFSACFGAPFLPRHPGVYAEMLGEKLREHGAKVWLVNTGWSGGGYGVGTRMKLSHTRAMVRAALSGELDRVETLTDAVFGLNVPTSVPGVPSEVLHPRDTWASGEAYDAAAGQLAEMFKENFNQFADQVAEEIWAAGPR